MFSKGRYDLTISMLRIFKFNFNFNFWRFLILYTHIFGLLQISRNIYRFWII